MEEGERERRDALERIAEGGVVRLLGDRVGRATLPVAICFHRTIYDVSRKPRPGREHDEEDEADAPSGNASATSSPPGRITSPYRWPHLARREGGMAQKNV